MPATAFANKAAMYTELRAILGQGTSTEDLTDADMDAFFEQARREINKRDPLWLFSSFTAVSGQQRYTLTEAGVEATLYGQMEVFWRPGASGGTCTSPGIFTSLGDVYDYVLLNVIGGGGIIPHMDETALELNARFNSQVSRFFGGRGWLEKDDFVYLQPQPSAGETVYFYAEVERIDAPENVDVRYADALMAWAAYKGAMAMAIKAGEVISASLAMGKSVRTEGGARYSMMAAEALSNFYDHMMLPAGVDFI